MHRRDTPRLVPETPLYYDVQLTPELRHTVRLPSATVFAQLIEAVPVMVLPALMAAAEGDVKGLFGLKDHASAVIGLLGAVIGLSWYNVNLDLDTTPSGDLLAFGNAVVEELHEAEVGISLVGRLALTIFRELEASAKQFGEVNELIPFTVERRGVKSGSTSTSE